MNIKGLFKRNKSHPRMLTEEDTVSVPTFARMIGMSVKTVYHWIYLGKLKAFKDEGHWRVVKNQITTHKI